MQYIQCMLFKLLRMRQQRMKLAMERLISCVLRRFFQFKQVVCSATLVSGAEDICDQSKHHKTISKKVYFERQGYFLYTFSPIQAQSIGQRLVQLITKTFLTGPFLHYLSKSNLLKVYVYLWLILISLSAISAHFGFELLNRLNWNLIFTSDCYAA